LGAALVHLAAVVLGERWPVETPAGVGNEGPIITVEQEPPVLSPQVDDAALPPVPPEPPPLADSFVHEPPASPPPSRRAAANAIPLARRTSPGAAPPSSIAAGRVMALSAPRPEYPYEARRQRLTGSGVAMLTVDFTSGNVLDVVMVQSTGSRVLDSATTSGLRRWHFKPRTVSKVRTPITFTLAGASY